MLLVLGWRPEDLDELGLAFAAAASSLTGVVELTLGRLDRGSVERLASAAGGSPAIGADALLERSEGLPLYIVEALAAGTPGGEGTSAGIRVLFRQRLASVSGTAAQILSAAAVLGRSFDLALVRGTSGRTDDEAVTALEELVRRAIVREVPGPGEASFDFAHARLRDAAYEATGLARRRLLHRRAADLLRSNPAGRDDPARLVQVAVHERAAGRDAEAAEAYRAAGMRARRLYAHREAASHLEMALALGHVDPAGILLALGEVRTALGDYAAAVTAFEAAAAGATEDALPGVELRLGRVHARRGDLQTAASHLDAAIDALSRPPASDPANLLRALVERALVARRAGDLEGASDAASRALAIAEQSGDDAGAGAAFRILGLVAGDRGDLVAARRALLRSLVLAEADPDAGAAIAARNALALVAAAAGDLDTAIGLLETALAACHEIGDRHLEAAVENNLADQLHAAGRSEASMAHLTRAVALFAEVGGLPGELQPEIWKLVAW